MFDSAMIGMILLGLWETVYMTLISTLVAYVIGLPLGIILVITDKDGIHPMPAVYRVIDVVVNILRSVPFLILLIALVPLTRFIIGTALGSPATIVPLVIAAFPFVARLVESSIKEVDKGVIEAAQSMGAGTMQIIIKVMLPESTPSLIVQGAIATTTILGYSAMAGIVGGGGLGALAINYGYYRKETVVMLVTVVILVIVVQVFQGIGMKIASAADRRK